MVPELRSTAVEIQEQIERDALYANYLDRQRNEIDLLKRDEGYRIPENFDYMALEGLSNELKTKLTSAQPETLAQAGRVDGVTPAALTLILSRLRKSDGKKTA